MESHVQKAISLHITPLIRLLGAQHPKIMSIIQKCPTGSEALVLRIVTILTEKGRPPAALVSLIKEMAAERDLSPRFLVPIIAEFNKVRLSRHYISSRPLRSRLAGRDPAKCAQDSVLAQCEAGGERARTISIRCCGPDPTPDLRNCLFERSTGETDRLAHSS